MRYIIVFFILITSFFTYAQTPAYGFAKTYTLNANGSGFFRLLVQNDTIITLGNTPVPNPPYYPWKILNNKEIEFLMLIRSARN